MTKEHKGFIYILTNPSFKEYVKIGYAHDVEKRLQQLNRSEATPFAFRAYATYEVDSELTDKELHHLIDNLNPDLRSKEMFNGKPRVREFYELSPEEAFDILKVSPKLVERLTVLRFANPQDRSWKKRYKQRKIASMLSVENFISQKLASSRAKR